MKTTSGVVGWKCDKFQNDHQLYLCGDSAHANNIGQLAQIALGGTESRRLGLLASGLQSWVKRFYSLFNGET